MSYAFTGRYILVSLVFAVRLWFAQQSSCKREENEKRVFLIPSVAEVRISAKLLKNANKTNPRKDKYQGGQDSDYTFDKKS